MALYCQFECGVQSMVSDTEVIYRGYWLVVQLYLVPVVKLQLNGCHGYWQLPKLSITRFVWLPWLGYSCEWLPRQFVRQLWVVAMAIDRQQSGCHGNWHTAVRGCHGYLQVSQLWICCYGYIRQQHERLVADRLQTCDLLPVGRMLFITNETFVVNLSQWICSMLEAFALNPCWWDIFILDVLMFLSKGMHLFLVCVARAYGPG